MSTMMGRWMQALRNHLHLPTIERDIAEIKVAMEDQETRAVARQAWLANQQQQFEVRLAEFEKLIRGLELAIKEERSRRETELTLAATVAQLTNDINNLRGVVEEHLRATTFGAKRR